MKGKDQTGWYDNSFWNPTYQELGSSESFELTMLSTCLYGMLFENLT